MAAVHELLRVPFVAAPMVDQSELPYRMLLRRLGFSLCYTPMIHARNLLTSGKCINCAKAGHTSSECPAPRLDKKKRPCLKCGESGHRSVDCKSPASSIAIDPAHSAFFSTCPEDRPLVAQFCATEATDFIDAARLVLDMAAAAGGAVDAVDLNLGCPQPRAKQEGFGAFLIESGVDHICDMVAQTVEALAPVPVFCKFRIQATEEATVAFARRLERAGAAALAVHGRLREQRSHVGCVDWRAVAAVKAAVNVPVIGNGGIRTRAEAEQCLLASKVDAVMVGTTCLAEPWLLKGVQGLPGGLDRTEAALWTAFEYVTEFNAHPVSGAIFGRHLAYLLVIPWLSGHGSERLRQQEMDTLADALAAEYPAEAFERVFALALWLGNPEAVGKGRYLADRIKARRKRAQALVSQEQLQDDALPWKTRQLLFRQLTGTSALYSFGKAAQKRLKALDIADTKQGTIALYRQARAEYQEAMGTAEPQRILEQGPMIWLAGKDPPIAATPSSVASAAKAVKPRVSRDIDADQRSLLRAMNFVYDKAPRRLSSMLQAVCCHRLKLGHREHQT